jgi:hypothetical protein
VDPSKGTVEAYNNVIYNVGRMDPLQLGASFSCIYLANITNNGAAGGGTVQVFNNTLSDCAANNSANAQGSRGAFGVAGGASSTLIMNLRNNVAYQNAGEIYMDGAKAQITGDRNLWFGAGAAPTQTTNNLNVDPLFTNRAGGDFHLSASSPAKDSGITVMPNNPFAPNPGATTATDKDGVLRAQGAAFDRGAFEVFAGSTAPTGNPPPNVRVVVH